MTGFNKYYLFILFSTLVFAQQNRNVDFKSVDAALTFDINKKEIQHSKKS